MIDLPPNVYRVAQRAFDAIPGSPWVYWVGEKIRSLFTTLPSLGDIDPPREGINTGNNERFIRFWWEITRDNAWFNDYVPFVKGAPVRKYYGNIDEVLLKDLNQIKLLPGSAIRNPDFALHEAVAFLSNATGVFRARFIPDGCMFCSTGGRAIFPEHLSSLAILGLLNSTLSRYVLGLVNPTVTYTVGDIAKIPVADIDHSAIVENVLAAVRENFRHLIIDETTYDFIAPPRWDTGLEDLAAAEARLAALEAQIDDEVYRLYGISDADRAAIEAELAGGDVMHEDVMREEETEDGDSESRITDHESRITDHELAVRWISYAVGIVLGRFSPGTPGALGSAVYRREDFAVGSLPAPGVEEFDALVGPPERFAYVDEAGGRHVFPAEVEAALRALALPDGIAVLDAGHPRDLPARVEKALRLMLDGDNVKREGVKREEHASRFTFHEAVIASGAGGDLRAFLARDFFTQWHFKEYRQRPVYWPVQSAKRGYGFVLFHERVNRMTLYVLLRDYLDYKRNGVQLALVDLAVEREQKQGRERKQVEKKIAEATQLQAELKEFAETLERLVRAGYEPAPEWIDDGVLLRLAPLWEVIPLWKNEPRKAWEALAAGKYDWSHIAFRYWPARVKAACRENKSYALAHRHPEWYTGR